MFFNLFSANLLSFNHINLFCYRFLTVVIAIKNPENPSDSLTPLAYQMLTF